METFEPKKLLILRILQILQEFSNCDHKLRQNDIISLLKVQYDIECERKAVARNIDFLQQAGFDIVRDSDGIYFASRKFEPANCACSSTRFYPTAISAKRIQKKS